MDDDGGVGATALNTIICGASTPVDPTAMLIFSFAPSLDDAALALALVLAPVRCDSLLSIRYECDTDPTFIKNRIFVRMMMKAVRC